MKQSILLIMLAVICAGTVFSQKVIAQGAHAPAAKGKFLIMSDIHFNPFCYPTILNQLSGTDYTGWQALFESAGDNSYGVTGEDSYYQLFKSGLRAMQQQNSHPDMIVINGDFLCHNFNSTYNNYFVAYANQGQDSLRSFIRKTTSFVLSLIEQYFPGTPVLPVLGNNDDYCGDYNIQAAGSFLHFFAEQSEPMLRNFKHSDFISTFSTGGYYSVSMPWDSSEVFIGLNTIFFSKGYEQYDACTPTNVTNPGADELNWLRSTLADCAAKGKKVWMSYHIPPGIDVFSSTHPSVPNAPCNTVTSGMWKQGYNDTFLSLVSQYSGIIMAEFAGHTHMDDFRLLCKDSIPISFIHITPAVSPKFGNNPAFQEMTWDAHKMQLNNCVTYMFRGIESPGENNWVQEYDYAKKYGVKMLDAKSLWGVWKKIGSMPSVRNNYLKYYPVSARGQSPYHWHAYWCGIRYLTLQGFTNCHCNQK